MSERQARLARQTWKAILADRSALAAKVEHAAVSMYDDVESGKQHPAVPGTLHSVAQLLREWGEKAWA